MPFEVPDPVPGSVVEGPILPEPVEMLVTVAVGASIKLIGKRAQRAAVA